jgi:hypothetical protein
MHFLFMLQKLMFNYLYFVIIFALVVKNLNEVIFNLYFGLSFILKIKINNFFISLDACTHNLLKLHCLNLKMLIKRLSLNFFCFQSDWLIVLGYKTSLGKVKL